MRINDYIKLNDTNPEEALLKVDYNTLLPMFDKYYTQVYQGNVKFIDFPYMEKQYVELSRKYYMGILLIPYVFIASIKSSSCRGSMIICAMATSQSPYNAYASHNASEDFPPLASPLMIVV